MTIHNALQLQSLAQWQWWLARGWRFSAMVFLCLALVLRALVPQGWMPAAQQGGQDALFAMVVCTPDGPMEFQHSLAVQADDDAGSDAAAADHAKTLCGFSVLAWQALLDSVWLALLLLLLLSPLRVVQRRYRAPVWTPCTAIQAPRAPPVSV